MLFYASRFIVRNGNINMGAKLTHSDKSVKLVGVHWTLLVYKINGSNLGNKCFSHFGRNPIWPPLDIRRRTSYISVTYSPIFNILVSSILFRGFAVHR